MKKLVTLELTRAQYVRLTRLLAARGRNSDMLILDQLTEEWGND